MNTRLVLAIISNLLGEAALATVVLWGLPQLDIHLPLAALIALMVAWLVVAVILYRASSRALKRKPASLVNMLQSQGKVVSPLAPEGLVRIAGELWTAKSANGRIETGEEVSVVGQEGLKLMVRRSHGK